MRYILSIIIAGILFSTCKKDKFTTAPQISFKSVKPDVYFQGSTNNSVLPVITLHVTDAEGDLGFVDAKDTAFVYILNLRTNKFDSAYFPVISSNAAQKNFEADVDIKMNRFLGVPVANVKDTIYYKIYIKDFAKNKSNEIKTDKPIYYIP
jgi:hypothetical protein